MPIGGTFFPGFSASIRNLFNPIFFFYTADSRANFLKDKSDHGRCYVAIQNSSVALLASQLDVSVPREPKLENPRPREKGSKEK